MTAEGLHILIVDDEPNIRTGLKKGLSGEADRVVTAKDAAEALTTFDKGKFQLVIADVRLPGEFDGLELVRRIKHKKPETTAIMITAYGSVETAVEAMKSGAYDFIIKPIDLNLIRQQVRKALDHYRLVAENRELRDRLAGAGEISDIIGSCAAMQDVFRQIRQVASTDATVLIEGESGTGKELIARAIHQLSNRNNGPFVAVNLGALPETLLESELFGYEKGAFSGANRQKPGCFEQAQGGTLFLDEVTEMPAKSQIDLLRVLESQEFNRVGGEERMTTDARIISASNKVVKTIVDEGRFRDDLYYRLDVVPIQVPPLRERREDIPLLVEQFFKHFFKRHNRPSKQISSEAMQLLTQANWPGNVRQLRNLIERLVVTVIDDVIHTDVLPEELKAVRRTEADRTLVEAVEHAEKEAILAALMRCNYHREQTANALGVSIRTLHYKMNRYGLH